MTKIFITGIGTDVGKTVVSAIVTEALEADYYKPVQAGDLGNSDTMTVERLISNTTSKFHNNSYALNTPMSPHAAAEIDGVEIALSKIVLPDTDNHLVIEGAGGILVPLNNEHTILDIIDPTYKVIVVSRHYLGSINHTLMTLEILRSRGLNVHLMFNGDEHVTTESILRQMTNVPILGRINEEPQIDQGIIKKYAENLRSNLIQLLTTA